MNRKKAIAAKIMAAGITGAIDGRGIKKEANSFSNIVIRSAINSLGTVVMAVSGAAFNIEVISYDVLNSFSQACTVFVGQNYGANDLQP